MNKTISVMGIVKENKNGTLYIDVTEGRVFLGKTSGFVKGQEIMGDAVVSERKVNYPATLAVGTPGTAGYRPEQAAREEIGWSVENFYTEEMLTKKQEFATRKAQAAFTTAKITKATAAIANVTIETTADILALVG